MGKTNAERRVYTKGAGAAAGKKERPVSRIANDPGTGGNTTGRGQPRGAELARLQKENTLLRKTNESLKKSCARLRPKERPVVMYRFIKANLDRYTIKDMAWAFGISRSAYYKWIWNGAS